MRRRSAAALVLLAVVALVAGCDRAGRSAAGEGAPATAAADSLFAVGESLYQEERFDGARSAWRVALAHARASRDERAQARVLTWLGLASWRLADLDSARSYGEAALALKRRLGAGVDLARSYNALGLLASSEGRNTDARSRFEQAIAASRAEDDSLGETRALGNLANTLTYLGELGAARRANRDARAAARRLDDARLEGNALANEAMLDVWHGDARSAIARLDTARALYRRIDYATGEQNALGQLATAYEIMGELDRAFAALDTALVVAQRHELGEQQVETLRLLGGLHALVGDHRRAVLHHARADSLARLAGLASERASALRGSAVARLRLGDVVRARSDAATALRLHRAAAEPDAEIDDRLVLAEVERAAGVAAAAGAQLDSARRLAGALGSPVARASVALAEAEHAAVAGDAGGVLAALAGVRPDLATGGFAAAARADALLARAHARLGALDSAAAAGRRAVDAVERMRGRLATEPLGTSLVADRAVVYGELVLTLLRLQRRDEAFAVADAARSRALVEHLAVVRGARAGGLPPELVRGDSLLREIDELVRRLRAAQGAGPRDRGAREEVQDAVASRLASARGEYEALLLRVRESSPRSAALLGVRPPSLAEVRAAMEPGEVLVQYLLAGDRLVVFAVSRDTLGVVERELRADVLAEQASLLVDLWGASGGDWRRGLPAAHALHATLVAPLRDAGHLRGATRLLVVPHGVLGHLPFAALADARTGRFLVEEHEIVQLPSAAALPALRRPAVERATVTGSVGLAPFPDALPASPGELASLRRAMPGATTHRGDAAGERAVRRALAEAAVVHVASHGVLNVRNPMFSRLELAPARRGRAVLDDDGRLEVHELLTLPVRSRLVFLSGCETGAGQAWADAPLRSTANVTLAQALLAAGASNVVSTLWRIDDAGAAVFADHFYRGLAGRSPAAALARAQRAMARDPRWASPYHWAGHVLAGAGRADPAWAAQTLADRSVR